MDDLNRATFFDGRTAGYLSRLLATYGGTPSPLSSTEKELAAEVDGLRELNELIKGKLVPYLVSCQEFISVPDGALFLLDAQSIGKLDDAKVIMDMAVREQIELSSQELYTALEASKSMSPDWLVNFFGSVSEGRHAKEAARMAQKPTGLNFAAMENFR